MKLPNIYKCNSTDILNTTLIDFVDDSVDLIHLYVIRLITLLKLFFKRKYKHYKI